MRQTLGPALKGGWQVDWELIEQTSEYVELAIDTTLWFDADGLMFLEEDAPIKGEVWRLHNNDADPRPSNPHAHCVGGKNSGRKLHLGTRQLYAGVRPLGRYLDRRQFERLLDYARERFPGVVFPLPA